MFMSILTMLLPSVIKLVGWFADKQVLSDSQKTALIAFVQAMAAEPNNSKQARDKYQELYDRLSKV